MTDFDPLNPQARHMADESMIRTLRHQADAIWPTERPLFERYGYRPRPASWTLGAGPERSRSAWRSCGRGPS